MHGIVWLITSPILDMHVPLKELIKDELWEN
jgi:hypothetical protein